MVLLNKFRSIFPVFYFLLTPICGFSLTTRDSETVDLATLSAYVNEDGQKLRLVWEAFRKQYVFTDDGFFEPTVSELPPCPDNPETQRAFLNHVKEKSTEVVGVSYIRCGECNGTGKKFVTEGDGLSTTVFKHITCAGSGKIQAVISYRLIYSGTPPPRLPSKNQRDFSALEKRVAKGDTDAEFLLGEYCDSGHGTPKDPKRAMEMFTRCLMRKDPRGAFALGAQYERGSTIIQNNFPISIVFNMLGQSLGGGNTNLENVYRIAPPRDVMLGSWYGRIVVKEFKSGKILPQQLSALGIRELAEAYSLNKSVKLAGKDGEQELQDGMALLAGGDSQKPNFLQAHKKFIQAASYGQADALYSLGVFYDNGLAVSKNKSTAYVFYKLAATIAGEDYMKIAEKTLAPTCRTDENEAAYKLAFDQIGSGKTNNDKFAIVTALKDVEEIVASNPKPIASVANTTQVVFPDFNNTNLNAVGSGSGLIFNNEGYFFTNKHVVKDGKAFSVQIAGVGEMRRASLVTTDPVYDLAILKIENWKGISETGQPTPSLLVSASNASVGSRIFTVGYPVTELLNQSPKYTSGDLSSLNGPEDIVPGSMLVTCPIQPGNSGGALVLENGQVIGTVAATITAGRFAIRTKGALPQGLNMAIRIEYLRQLAERNSVKIPAPALRVVDPAKVITANSVIVFKWQ